MQKRKIKLTMGSEDDIYSFDKPCMWPWNSMFIGTEGKNCTMLCGRRPETWSMEI